MPWGLHWEIMVYQSAAGSVSCCGLLIVAVTIWAGQAHLTMYWSLDSRKALHLAAAMPATWCALSYNAAAELHRIAYPVGCLLLCRCCPRTS